MTSQKTFVYVTGSKFKRDECRELLDCCFPNGKRIGDLVEVKFRDLSIPETLEVDIETMVRAEVVEAYKRTRVPCIVEHAGLVFEGHSQYPGGLTKPMWNALQDKFVDACGMNGLSAVARAVVGYCDGKRVHLFPGETRGRLVSPPRGAHEFYWDRVFVPEGEERTYAELVEDPDFGLKGKVSKYSQSSRALRSFLQHLLTDQSASKFWQ